MIIKIERKEKKEKPKKSKKPSKQRKVPMIKVGTHKKLTFVLWVLLIGSVGFGIYKNFTAIDTHTVRETEIIKQQIVDTNQVESFVKSFAKDYFSWQQSQEAIDKRNEKLTHYLTEELQVLNEEMIRKDIPTSSSVNDIQVWQVSQVNENTFEYCFLLNKLLPKTKTRKLYRLAFMWLSI
ncbi:conjugative transposon-like protein [Staphylococcus aureus]|nr:conjugative transposon-like protein [Staphylococcus aureus]SUJ65810.1 conjugative transposon-like protein [Staphylococcus aureus]